MVFKKVLLTLLLASPLYADTGFTGTIRVTETDNSPACTVGQIKVTAGALTCNGQSATIKTGGGLPLPQGATNYIQNQANTTNNQPGATIDISSATIRGILDVNRPDLTGFSGGLRLRFEPTPTGTGGFYLYNNNFIGSSNAIQFRDYQGDAASTSYASIDMGASSFGWLVRRSSCSLFSPTTCQPVNRWTGNIAGSQTFNDWLGNSVLTVKDDGILTNTFNTSATSATVTGSGGLSVINNVTIGGDTSGAMLGVAGSENLQFNFFSTFGGFFFGAYNNFATGIAADGLGGMFLQTNSIHQLAISNTGSVQVGGADATNTYSFRASSQTTSSTYFTIALSTSGHILTQGPAPAISACGATPSGSVVGNDNEGTIAIGGGVVTACTLTFANTWGNVPVCTITDNSTAITGDISAVSNTAFTTSFSASLGGGTVYYRCGCHGAGCR